MLKGLLEWAFDTYDGNGMMMTEMMTDMMTMTMAMMMMMMM